MAEMPGMIRPDLQALPQVRDRMTFLYLELAQACGQMLDGTFPRIRGGDPQYSKLQTIMAGLFPARAGVIPYSAVVALSLAPFPRIRGGDPQSQPSPRSVHPFSPHTRG